VAPANEDATDASSPDDADRRAGDLARLAVRLRAVPSTVPPHAVIVFVQVPQPQHDENQRTLSDRRCHRDGRRGDLHLSQDVVIYQALHRPRRMRDKPQAIRRGQHLRCDPW
jgi:hypothetical protein